MLIVIVSLRSVTVSDVKSAHVFMCVIVVCVCAWSRVVFIAIALNETSILVPVHLRIEIIILKFHRVMKNIRLG